MVSHRSPPSSVDRLHIAKSLFNTIKNAITPKKSINKRDEDLEMNSADFPRVPTDTPKKVSTFR